LPLLPPTWSGFVWFGLKAAAAVWCMALARCALLTDPASPARWWFLRPEWIAFWITGRYLLMDLQYGNTNLLVLLSLLLLAALWRAERRSGAGLATAAGVAIKVTPMLAVVTAALAGRLRWALGTAAAVALLFLASAGVLEWCATGAGTGFWRDVVAETGSMEMGRVDNQSLRGVTLRMVAGSEVALSTVSSIPNLGLGRTAARVAEGILAAGVLLLLFRLARSAVRGGKGAWAGLWAGTAIGILLLSPGSWTVHYALLYLPVVVLADRAQRGQWPAAVVCLVLAAVVLLPVFSRAANDWFTALSLLPVLSFGALIVLTLGDPAVRVAPARSQAGS
jgi:hypothetical protein